MSDTRRTLAEMVDPLFAELGPAATIERDGNRLDELGLPALLVPEADGGFGGSWMDALTVFRLAGYHALGIDLPDAIIARVAGRQSDQWFGLMAFARAAQIAGALDAALQSLALGWAERSYSQVLSSLSELGGARLAEAAVPLVAPMLPAAAARAVRDLHRDTRLAAMRRVAEGQGVLDGESDLMRAVSKALGGTVPSCSPQMASVARESFLRRKRGRVSESAR